MGTWEGTKKSENFADVIYGRLQGHFGKLASDHPFSQESTLLSWALRGDG